MKGWKQGFNLNHETNNTAIHKMYRKKVKLSFLGLKLHECLKKLLNFDGEVIMTASDKSLCNERMVYILAA